MKNVIACSKSWFENSASKNFKKNFYFIRKRTDLNIKKIKKINPRYIFFPHWSFKVPSKIFNNYECICFHTGPLPSGRGGSPIQNLIKRKIKQSPLCALKMVKKIDAGPIYCKKNLSLEGSLTEIFLRMTPLIQKLIKFIILNNPKPKKQKGKISYFKRIKPSESNINKEKSLLNIYNHIRMRDHDEYPRAFIKTSKFKVLFSNASLKKKFIRAEVLIKKK